MENKEEMTYYRFLSEIRSFLSKLLKDPIKAQPSKYLKDRGFDRTKTIHVLIKRDVIERSEKILTPDKTGEKKVLYNVTFKVKKQDFERKIRRIHAQYFEQNLPEKEKLNEEGECGGATSTASVGCDCTSGFLGYSAPLTNTPLTRGSILGTKKKKDDNDIDPTKILGKTISEEKKKTPKNVYLTEKQFNAIISEEVGATSTASVADGTTRGDLGYDVPAFAKSKNTNSNKKEHGTNNNFFKPAMERKPGFSCETLK